MSWMLHPIIAWMVAVWLVAGAEASFKMQQEESAQASDALTIE